MRTLTLLATAIALAGCAHRTVPPDPARALALDTTRPVPVVVYVTSWCPVCVRARAWLDAQGYPYIPVDVERDLEASLRLRKLSPRGSVPTFDVDGRILVGFDPDALRGAVAGAAARRYAEGASTAPDRAP